MSKTVLFSNRVNVAPTVYSSSTLTTSPVKVTLAAGNALGDGIHVKIINLHASQLVAFTLVDAGAAAPTVNATLGNASCGAIVAPASECELVISPAKDLYIVASAASTSVAVWSVSA
jgi:hypothetical protein